MRRIRFVLALTVLACCLYPAHLTAQAQESACRQIALKAEGQTLPSNPEGFFRDAMLCGVQGRPSVKAVLRRASVADQETALRYLAARMQGGSVGVVEDLLVVLQEPRLSRAARLFVVRALLTRIDPRLTILDRQADEVSSGRCEVLIATAPAPTPLDSLASLTEREQIWAVAGDLKRRQSHSPESRRLADCLIRAKSIYHRSLEK